MTHSYKSAASIRQDPPPPVKPKITSALSPASLPGDDFNDECSRLSLDYEGLDLADRDTALVNVERSKFAQVDLRNSHLDRASFSDVAFSQCDLANMTFRECSLIRTAVSGCRMTGATFLECTAREVLFDSCPMDLTSFRFCKFGRVKFTDCKLTRADFQGAGLKMAWFERCDLTGVQFSNAEMEGAYFSDCLLYSINGVTSMKGATVRMRDAAALVYSLASALGIQIDES